MKTLRAGTAALLLVAGLGLAPVSSATAAPTVAAPAVAAPAAAAPAALSLPSAAPKCRQRWDTTVERQKGRTTARIVDLKAGRHNCFDRLVVELKGKTALKGYEVRYVKAVYTEGQGKKVPLSGKADLQVVVRAPAYNSKGQSTYVPDSRKNAVNVRGFTTFRQVAYLGSFEGQTSFGLGVRDKLPFRVFIVDGPGNTSRLVVDVAHRR